MAGTKFVDGPAYVANSAADLYNPAANTFALVYHIKLINKDSSARTVSLYLGATGGSAGGTEIIDPTHSLAATGSNSAEKDIYFPNGLKVTSSQYISGVASAASAIVCIITGELFAA